MTESAPVKRRGRGRRPFAEVHAEVLEAAGNVLMDEGLSGFTVEKVVIASGVSSATVYKYWPSRGALALDGYLHVAGDSLARRDTGNVEADLKYMLTAFVKTVTRKPFGPVFAQLVGTAQTDTELAAQFDRYFGPRRSNFFAILEAAKTRGQLRRDTDVGVLVDTVWGACLMRLLLPHLTSGLTPQFVGEVVDQALTGVLVEPAPTQIYD
ncbi:TetR/AcrR family transcriptional regulator [Rhodococcus koreensis]